MRNLAQYPVTKDDKIAAVRWALEHYDNHQRRAQVVGDVTGAALQAILEDLQKGLPGESSPSCDAESSTIPAGEVEG